MKNNIFSKDDMKVIKKSNICIVGAGGLGGYILEMFVRAGIGSITIVDGDTFEVSNLNRQLLSNEKNIGTSKVESAFERVTIVNSDIDVLPVYEYLNNNNSMDILKGHDLVIDALDNIQTRKIIQNTCEKLDICMIHGAISGWYGQVAVIYPGDKTIDLIYGNDDKYPSDMNQGSPSFTPALVAAVQVAESLKLLIGKPCLKRGVVLYMDLLMNTWQEIEL
jgi:molybdopterin/thiamine biosynthesis adenylyltransferase